MYKVCTTKISKAGFRKSAKQIDHIITRLAKQTKAERCIGTQLLIIMI